ncbi:MAG TPA: 23S rRNA (pseudouridine(1915)-N(3))-methyltransferase RlmH [Candidatus Saccharimonadales bacterium]|nr:23S rRNA (pseudouridine(1915)-N(3))-methyltransferase RlmH [Candidatus Saccharimonadales bacterium]
MKLHIVTIGEPKLAYAKAGWEEYLRRLQRYHQVRITHLADKWANDASRIMQAIGAAYSVGLVVEGKQFSSPSLATFLEQRAQEGREVCFVIGGPEGLPPEVRNGVDVAWSFSDLTFPHDLAMVILVEAVYRASTLAAGHPYHKA